MARVVAVASEPAKSPVAPASAAASAAACSWVLVVMRIAPSTARTANANITTRLTATMMTALPRSLRSGDLSAPRPFRCEECVYFDMTATARE